MGNLGKLDLLEGLHLDCRTDTFMEELGWRHGCRWPSPPSQLTTNSCSFTCHIVGLLVRLPMQKKNSTAKNTKFINYR